MEKEYNNFLCKLNNDIEDCKRVLDCCCSEIHLAMKQLDNRSLERKNIADVERINKKIKAENEVEKLDLQEVDELIQKAKKVLTFQDSIPKNKIKKVKIEASRPKSTNVLIGKQKPKHVVSNRGLTSVQTMARSKSANPRTKTSLHKSKEETQEISVNSQSILPKESFKEPKILCSPYSRDFLQVFLQLKKISKALRGRLNNNKQDRSKAIQQFMNTLTTPVETKVSLSIQESDDIVERILHSFSGTQFDLKETEINDLLLNHVRMENIKLKLDFLLRFSSFLKQYFLVTVEENPQNALGMYRSLHYLLGGSMPVLLQDEIID